MKALNLFQSLNGFFSGFCEFDALLKLSSQPYLENISAYENETVNLKAEQGAFMIFSGRYIDYAAFIIGKRKISQSVMRFVINIFMISGFHRLLSRYMQL